MSRGYRQEPETLTSDNEIAVARQVVQRYVHAGRRRAFDLIKVFGSPVQLCHAVCDSVWAERTCISPGAPGGGTQLVRGRTFTGPLLMDFDTKLCPLAGMQTQQSHFRTLLTCSIQCRRNGLPSESGPSSLVSSTRRGGGAAGRADGDISACSVACLYYGEIVRKRQHDHDIQETVHKPGCGSGIRQMGTAQTAVPSLTLVWVPCVYACRRGCIVCGKLKDG